MMWKSIWRAIRGAFTGRNYSDDELRVALRWTKGDNSTPVMFDGPLREADRSRLHVLEVERIKERMALRAHYSELAAQAERAMG